MFPFLSNVYCAQSNLSNEYHYYLFVSEMYFVICKEDLFLHKVICTLRILSIRVPIKLEQTNQEMWTIYGE